MNIIRKNIFHLFFKIQIRKKINHAGKLVKIWAVFSRQKNWNILSQVVHEMRLKLSRQLWRKNLFILKEKSRIKNNSMIIKSGFKALWKT